MFIATLFVLTIFGPVEVQDSHGGYLTEQECIERVDALSVYIERQYSPMGLISIDGKCTLDNSQAV